MIFHEMAAAEDIKMGVPSFETFNEKGKFS
jgi:hypothetical protein